MAHVAFPPDIRKHNETPYYDAQTTPNSMLQNHSTLPGVWACILIKSGTIDYFDIAERTVEKLEVGIHYVIAPEARHKISVSDDVCFKLEFFKQPDDQAE